MANNADVILAEIREAKQAGDTEQVDKLFGELDDWLMDGGELPDDWKQYTVGR